MVLIAYPLWVWYNKLRVIILSRRRSGWMRYSEFGMTNRFACCNLLHYMRIGGAFEILTCLWMNWVNWRAFFWKVGGNQDSELRCKIARVAKCSIFGGDELANSICSMPIQRGAKNKIVHQIILRISLAVHWYTVMLTVHTVPNVANGGLLGDAFVLRWHWRKVWRNHESQ